MLSKNDKGCYAHGLTYDDMEKANFIGFTDAADAIKDGHVDALFVMSTF